MLSEVEFHTGVTDPVGYAARLVRKAFRAGVRVLVTAPPSALAELDRLLWQEPERDFVPHVRWPGAAAAVAARTPIWLCGDVPASEAAAPRVVVNVGAPAPQEVQPLDRLIEIVGTDPDDVAAGRDRWRGYKTHGLDIRHHTQG